MEKVVKISPWQKVTTDDYNKFGSFVRTSLDTIVGKTLIPDLAFEGFGCSQSGPAEVTVAIGHLWYNGKIYVNDSTGGTSIDLSAHLPAATQRIITITSYGSEIDSKLEARTFLTDADTRATVARETSTENWRWANVASVSGIEGPDPQPPALAVNVCPLAYVTLGTTGVLSIQRADDYVVPTLRECDSRLNVFDIWKIAIGSRIDTLASDLLALAARIIGLAKWDFVHQLASDFARVKDTLHLPDAYQAWGADHFLTTQKSDPTHADWLCFCEEGVRFPFAAEATDQLGLLNPFDELVINSSSVLLPRWEAVTRLTNKGSDVEQQISTYTYQTTNYVQKTMTRTRLRYGPAYTVCSNTVYWDAQTNQWKAGFVGVVDMINWTFIRDTGEVYNIESTITDAPGHIWYRLQKVWVDTYEEAYWDIVIDTHAVSGSVMAQSFVNSQDGWLCELDLFFSRVAATGSVTVLVAECTNGMPDVNKVLAVSTRNQNDLHISPAGQDNPTTFAFQPTFLTKDRYAFIIVTGGNHFLWALQDTNFVSGSMFYSTDGQWFQGDLTKDIAFEAKYCRFFNNQTRVQLNPLSLQNGIAAIDVNAKGFSPPGCSMYFEAQKDGVWHPLTRYSDVSPDFMFIGLPPLMLFRAVFVGTADVQPALGVASNSRVRVWRPRSDFTHISEIRTPGATVHTITCRIRLEAWAGGSDSTPAVGSNHRFDMHLMSGASYLTLTVPTTTSVEVAPDDPGSPGAIIINYTWTGVTLTSYRFKLEGDTDNVLTTFHVAERIDVAIV